MPIRKPSPRVLLLAIALLAGLILLFVDTLRSGPDTTVTGLVATIEQHRVCVAEEGETPHCAQVDYPGVLNGIHVGDCVTIKQSGEGWLVDINPVDGCG